MTYKMIECRKITLNTQIYTLGSQPLKSPKIAPKLTVVSLIRNTSYFSLHDRFLAYDLTLSRYYFEMEAWSHEPNTFFESLVYKVSVGTNPNNFLIKVFWVQSLFPKKSHFHRFPCRSGGKCCSLVYAQF